MGIASLLLLGLLGRGVPPGIDRLAGLSPAAHRAGPAAEVWRVDELPAEHHPCLLFSADDLPRMRERMERPPFSGWWPGIAAGGDMVSQALTWRLTGDEAKAQAVRENLLRCNPTGYHCCCGVADALQGVAEAYDLVYDYPGLSESDHRIIRAKIAAACERLYLSALESGAGQHPGNQRTRGLCALGTAAMVLADYGDAAHTPEEWLQRALDGIHEDRNLAFWRDDGMFIEGPTYSAFTLSVMLPFARYYRNVTGRWLFDDPRLRNALQYLIYVTQPDGDCNAMGTTNMMNVVNSLELCIGAGDPSEQAAFRWALGEWGAVHGGVREFCLFDDAVKPSISGLRTSRLFPQSQEVSWRSEWSRYAVSVWLKGKDPWIAANYPVYSHGDAGSFVVHAYGELLAVDAGYDHWVSYNLYPANLHNTLLVDGEGPDKGTPGIVENVIDAEFVRTADVVTEYAGVKLRRAFLLIEDQFIAIVDDIQADAEHDYAWQIHTPVSRARGEIAVEGNHASWTGFDPRTDNPGRVTLDAYWAGNVDVEAVEGSRWQPHDPDPKAGSYDNWTVVARQRGRNVRFVTVLYPHPAGQGAARIEPLPELAKAALSIAREQDRFLVVAPERGEDAPPCSGRAAVWADKAGSPDWFWIAGPGGLRWKEDEFVELSDQGVAAAQYWEDFYIGRVHLAGPDATTLRIQRLVGATRHGLVWWTDEEATAVPPIADGPWSFTLPKATRGPAILGAGPARDSPRLERDSPKVVSVRIDREHVQGEELVDLGRVAAPPHQVWAEFGDEGTGLDPHSGRTTLDGVPDRLGSGIHMEYRAPTGMVQYEHRGGGEPLDYELVFRVRDGALPPNYGQFNLHFSLRPLLANGGFEETGGWSFGTWSDDEQTKYETKVVADNPHSGNRCLLMRGIAGQLNMVAAQSMPLRLGTTYVLSGYYRGDVPAKASLCNGAGTGQYIWSPPIGPSAEWAPFEWEFTVENPATPLIVALRLGSVGAAYFDDAELREKAAGR